MIRLPNTLAFRLSIWYAIFTIVFIAVALNASYLTLDKTLTRNIEQDLIEDIGEFQTLYQNEGLEGVKRAIKREMIPGEEDQYFFQLFDKSGKRIFSSDLSHWNDLPENKRLVEQVFSNKQFVFQTLDLQEHEHKIKTIYDLISPDILLYTGESTEEAQELLSLLFNVFISVLLIAVPIVSIVGRFMAKQAVKGIKEVSHIASKIEKGKLDRRVSVSAQGEEITQLVDTFNAMLDRIWVLVSEMKEMTDNIAHDLRSPLARIRVISEQVLSSDKASNEFKSVASDTIEECDRLLQMINSTLDVAEAEAGTLQTSKQQINVSQLVQDACDLFEAIAEQKEIKLVWKLENNLHIHGNIQNLQRMLANILDNAIKYTPVGGLVEVALNRAGENIEILVRDNGMGIPEADQSRVFDRFFRCDQSRTLDGCGLGLSFSRAVAHSHNGYIVLSSNLENGSCFTIKLPLIDSLPLNQKGNYLH